MRKALAYIPEGQNTVDAAAIRLVFVRRRSVSHTGPTDRRNQTVPPSTVSAVFRPRSRVAGARRSGMRGDHWRGL